MTERLRAEALRLEHANVMYPILVNPEIYHFLDEEAPVSLEALRVRYEFLSGAKSPDGNEDWLNWILFCREHDEAVGYVQATVKNRSCSIGYVIDPQYWGKGYASEATKAVIDLLFRKYFLEDVVAEIHPDNVASKALVNKLGFSFVRHDALENDDVFSIARKDWSMNFRLE